MSVGFSPVGNSAPFVDGNGDPLNGGLLSIFLAGSSTPATTFSDSTGLVPNANPIVLNSNGYPASGGNVVEIWLTAGSSYKFILKTAASVTIWTRDRVPVLNDVSAAFDQWLAGPTPTFVSATSFSLVGDQSSVFHVGRRLKTTNTAGTTYSRISASAFGVLTTVTVVNESGVLDSGLSAVSYSLLSATNPATPVLQDTDFLISGSSDKTKLVRLEVDGLTTATKRTITVPDQDFTLNTSGALAAGRNIAARTNAATPNTKLDISADEIVLKDTNNAVFMARSVAVTINLGVVGANGIDAATQASSTWYYGYVIAKADGTIAGLASTSATAPTLPSGYVYKALVTSARSNGSTQFLAYRQFGNCCYYEVGQSALSGGTSGSEVAVSVASLIPPIALEFTISTKISGNSSGGTIDLRPDLRFIAGQSYRSSGDDYRFYEDNAGATAGFHRNLGTTPFPNVGQQFFYAFSAAAGTIGSMSCWVLFYKLPGGGQ